MNSIFPTTTNDGTHFYGSNDVESAKSSQSNGASIKKVDSQNAFLEGASIGHPGGTGGDLSSTHIEKQVRSFEDSSHEDLEVRRQEFFKNDLPKLSEKVVHNLNCFLNFDAEKEGAKVFVFQEEPERTGENRTLEVKDQDSSDLVLEASQEAAKDFFVNQLSLLHGEKVVRFFYPEKEQAEPLTVAKSKELQEKCNSFELSVLQSCGDDLSTYEKNVDLHLEVLSKAEEALAALNTDPTMKGQVEALSASLEAQLGISHTTALLLLGSGVALGAALTMGSGTLAIPAAVLLKTMAPALVHASGASATAGSLFSTALTHQVGAHSAVAMTNMSHLFVTSGAHPTLTPLGHFALNLGSLGVFAGTLVGATSVFPEPSLPRMMGRGLLGATIGIVLCEMPVLAGIGIVSLHHAHVVAAAAAAAHHAALAATTV